MMATVVETKELLQTVVASLAAGIGVTATFSIMIFGATRFAELRRDNRAAGATLFAVLAAAGLIATGAGIIFGIVVMTQKS